MKPSRRTKIAAALGPASSDEATMRALCELGVDVFRLDFSQGTGAEHAQRIRTLRRLEAEVGRPLGVLLDLQGPRLRLGALHAGTRLERGARFRLDLEPAPGDARRAPLPQPQVLAALEPGAELLLDDGRLRLRVERRGATFADTRVVAGGPVAEGMDVFVPSVALPVSPLTERDRADLELGLELGVDWVAVSCVQRPQDIDEARAIVGTRAWIMAKLEKPAAVEQLDAIVARSDGVMVARGDLGVELPPEQVPELQRLIVRVCRQAGKPVVVSTQMLESMITAPAPTRAEVNDVAAAVYDGVDAVMLSAESASGRYPLEAVAMMQRIVSAVEGSALYRNGLDLAHAPAQATVADAICASLRQVASMLAPAATVTYTSSGFTSLRAARERPAAPILCLTPHIATARRMAMVWGVHAVLVDDVRDIGEMSRRAGRVAIEQGFARAGHDIVVVAGLPFGQPGATNLLHVARIPS